MPEMCEDFGATEEELTWSLMLNWFVKGISCLIVAYLSDKYGRKIMVQITMTIYVIGTIIC
jgi:MFS family permease